MTAERQYETPRRGYVIPDADDSPEAVVAIDHGGIHLCNGLVPDGPGTRTISWIGWHDEDGRYYDDIPDPVREMSDSGKYACVGNETGEIHGHFSDKWQAEWYAMEHNVWVNTDPTNYISGQPENVSVVEW